LLHRVQAVGQHRVPELPRVRHGRP
jgi:hypothetical protein